MYANALHTHIRLIIQHAVITMQPYTGTCRCMRTYMTTYMKYDNCITYMYINDHNTHVKSCTTM